MKQRFIDCDMWEDEWFLGLPILYKSFWIYIFSRCDVVGVWKPAYKMAGLVLGENISEHQALELFNSGKERIKILPNGSWWITGFIPFQYKKLKYTCNPHLSVIRLAETYGLDISQYIDKDINTKGSLPLPYRYPTATLQDKEQDKDISSSAMLVFNKVWAVYPARRRGDKQEAIRTWLEHTPPTWADRAVSEAVKSVDWQKDDGAFIPGLVKWIRSEGWDSILNTHKIVICDSCGGEGVLPNSVAVNAKKIFCRECAAKQKKEETISSNTN